MATKQKHTHQLPDDVLRREYERARSGAAGTHGDRRTKRLRSRGDRRRAALREFA